jgi:peptidoglycan/xylan/chitin deacetylase (PgdA/CDA1 family)
LISCSFFEKKSTPVTNRSVARYDEAIQDITVVKSRIDKLMNNIFHSYLLGQVALQQFDKQLVKNPVQAMQHSSYSELLSVRSYVDQFEEDLHELYVSLVLVSALPKYTQEEKAVANESLASIGRFMEGIRGDSKELPLNLKPMVLSNLREKQTALYEVLKTLSENPSVTENNQGTIDIIYKNMILLRATRLAFYKDLEKYKVDPAVIEAAIKEESQEANFVALREQVKALSIEMKKYIKEARLGRSTSSDSIVPSAGISGNVTGNSFPTNTWSLTYDDGPGSKTSATVLENLKAKGIRATFFMLAKQVEALPGLAKTIADAPGQDMASHSYDHAQLTKVGPVALEKQIGGAKAILEAKLGKKIKLFRLPYGAGVGVAAVRAKIAAHNMIHIFWNVDTLDWQDKNPQSIYERALRQIKAMKRNNGIVLFHDIHAQSVVASAKLMDYFNQTPAIKVCTVQEVIDQINQDLPECKKAL